MKATSYKCSTCTKVFTAFREGAVSTPCPYCGGTASEFLREGAPTPSASSRGSFVAPTYECGGCGHEYEQVVTEGSQPSCPKCRAVGGKALTPGVNIVYSAVAPSRKDSYLKETGELITQARGLMSSSLSLFKRLGLTQEALSQVNNVFANAIDTAQVYRNKRLESMDD